MTLGPSALPEAGVPAPPTAPRRPAAWVVVLGTALSYGAAGLLALLLAMPPGLVSPLYPSAGIALAATLVFGRAALPGVVLGALLVNGYMLAPRELPTHVLWMLPLISSLGAAAQAALGAWLVRRWVAQPLVLTNLACVLRFFACGALVACVLNSSLSTATLLGLGMVPLSAGLATWWTWWLGDTLGVLIGAPIALTLIALPRADWAPRRITLALPLLLTTVLLAAGTLLVASWDAQRARTIFERDAAMASAALQSRLRHGADALQAMRGLFIASDSVSAAEFKLATLPWVQQDTAIQALGFSQRVRQTDRSRFEHMVAADDGEPLRIFDRPLVGGGEPLAPRSDMVVIRHIEPRSGNAAARGLNSLSVPAAREAIDRALLNLGTAATVPFGLTQTPDDASGVVIYQGLPSRPLSDGLAANVLADSQRSSGVVFLTLRTSQLVEAARAGTAPYLVWCLWDMAAGTNSQRLAGAQGCRQPAAEAGPWLKQEEQFEVGGRPWQLTLQARAADIPDLGGRNAWLFATVGLACAAVLSTLLLTVTGHTRRTEAAVEARTADLQHEIQARERTAVALQASKQRLRNIFDQAPAGIVFADMDGRLRDANPRMCDLLGQTVEQLVGRDVAAVVTPHEQQALSTALAAMVKGELPELQRQARLAHRDGSTRWVQTSWSTLRGDDGAPNGLVGVVEDITERLKRAEAEQGRQLAESANRAKSDFLSRMSHELRTPLNAMLGFTQLLELDRKPPLAPHQAAWAAQVLQAGWHLLEMINDTLDLSRIEAGVVRLQTEMVALAPVVAQSLALVAKQAEARQIRIHTELRPEAATVLADPTRLKQVLTNLLSNAVKYNKAGGEVLVTSSATADGQVSIQVCDTGAGLSDDELAQLFQPFNRLGQEQGGIEGTGIGLVISRHLAELMSGSLRAHSTSGAGATFELHLPAGQAVTAPEQGPDRADRPTQAYPRCELLYIEDNQTNVALMQGILKQRPQVHLSLCHSAQAGLAWARSHRPQLVLLDLHLPDGDGIQVLRELKSDPRTAGIPVLAVSADATPDRMAAARAAGADHYLTKPLNVGQLLAVLDERLAQADRRPRALALSPP